MYDYIYIRISSKTPLPIEMKSLHYRKLITIKKKLLNNDNKRKCFKNIRKFYKGLPISIIYKLINYRTFALMRK